MKLKLRTELRQRLPLAVAVGIIMIIAAILVVASLSSLQRDETWERIQRQGFMYVGMDASYPPFDLVDAEAHFVGYDVDLAFEIGARLGVRVEFVNIFFDGLYDALYSERIDLIISALPHDRLLTRDVAYSYSYFNAGPVLLVAKEDDRIHDVVDLSGQRVVVELGSAAHQEGRRLSRSDKIEFTLDPKRTLEEVISALVEGSADAALYDGIAARQLTGQGTLVKIVNGPLSDEPYVIAVRLDSSMLLEVLNEAIVELREEGFFQKLDEKWF